MGMGRFTQVGNNTTSARNVTPSGAKGLGKCAHHHIYVTNITPFKKIIYISFILKHEKFERFELGSARVLNFRQKVSG